LKTKEEEEIRTKNKMKASRTRKGEKRIGQEKKKWTTQSKVKKKKKSQPARQGLDRK
jgi:hypothetical protein